MSRRKLGFAPNSIVTQAPASQANAIRAVVTRQVYLGAARDYMLEVADGTNLRATTPTETNIPKGSEVWLTLPPEHCRALRRGRAGPPAPRCRRSSDCSPCFAAGNR